MRDNFLKTFLKKTYFRKNSTHYIWFGPIRGMKFRVSEIGGLEPLYSGVERRHQKAFRELLKPGDIAIDVGANWGLHTLYLSRLVGETGRVVAVEPYPGAFEELRWHIDINHCQNVTLQNLAAGDEEKEERLIDDLGQMGVLSSVSHLRKIPEKVSFAVLEKPLDRIAEDLKLSKINLIKIDVEGAENKVLSGAEKIVKAHRPYFVIDLHALANDIFAGEWFNRHGYSLKRIKAGPPITRTDVGWPNKDGVWGHILAIP